jgi:putative transposase
MQVIGLAVHLVKRAAKIATDLQEHPAKELPHTRSDGAPPKFGHKDQMILVFVRRIRNRVDDARHKLTTTLAKNHGCVVVEELALRSLTRSARGSVEAPGGNVAAKARLNWALLKRGHSETVRQLGYKLGWCGGELNKVDPAFTSQMCPQCGHVCPENRPARDLFTCVACGHSGHADNAAAMNILAAGQAVSARGGPRGPAKREPICLRRSLRRQTGIPAL